MGKVKHKKYLCWFGHFSVLLTKSYFQKLILVGVRLCEGNTSVLWWQQLAFVLSSCVQQNCIPSSSPRTLLQYSVIQEVGSAFPKPNPGSASEGGAATAIMYSVATEIPVGYHEEGRTWMGEGISGHQFQGSYLRQWSKREKTLS